MNLAGLSIKRPAFITSIVIMMLSMGWMTLNRLGVDLFPDITFPIVTVTVPYPGAGPAEVETLVSRVLEEEISTLAGIKSVRSVNKDSVSIVVAEFTLETDVKWAEQQIRDRVGTAKRKLPTDAEEPLIRRIDPSDQPVAIVSISANLSPGKLYDLAYESIKPKFEQIPQVGLVEIVGGRKREIRVELDRDKLKRHEVSATQVADRIRAAGKNIPAGKVDDNKQETLFRTLGEFKSVKEVGSVIVSFLGNDVPVTVDELGKVTDTLEDEKSRFFLNGDKALSLLIYRQSGANTIAVVDGVAARIAKLNKDLGGTEGSPKIDMVREQAKWIRANVNDVKESIMIGILLTIIVVFFFLGNVRSTIITGLALPNSLLGAFIFMGLFGFTVNIMTLLALSLSVGLLIDDAIVVRENIFRHNQMGKNPIQAALEGTKEVSLAVIATSLTIIAVFGPIAFLHGVVGQFFKQFGLTVCFAMVVSLFDALTIAPMLSAYFAGKAHGFKASTVLTKPIEIAVNSFARFQDRLEVWYEATLKRVTRRPLVTLGIALLVFIASMATLKFIPKTFISAHESGEFLVALDLPQGSSLDATNEVANQVDKIVRANKEVIHSVLTVGNSSGESNVVTLFVTMVPLKERSVTTAEFKDRIRKQLEPFAYANPVVKDMDIVGGGMRPFAINLIGDDYDKLREYAEKLFAKLKNHPGMKDPELSYREGKPELQVQLDQKKAERLGVSSALLGTELRAQIEGVTPAVFREFGREYDVRVRLQENQRNLKEGFAKTFVPNINYSIIPLTEVAKPVLTKGPATISRVDRGRYIQIGADIAPDGPGMSAVMADIDRLTHEGDTKLPPGIRYSYYGQAENFLELISSIILAGILATLFIYLVLVSLYESFITPLTIMLVLPLAASGAFLALAVTRKTLDLFSMIGCIMLLGIATKNSILLVDYIKQKTNEGMDTVEAIILAGKVRLRPILMTSFALIAGMLPVAIGLNEASRQRMSMGVAVIGGLISSTVLTLVVVPAAYTYIERFRLWTKTLAQKSLAPHDEKSSSRLGRRAAQSAPATTDAETMN